MVIKGGTYICFSQEVAGKLSYLYCWVFYNKKKIIELHSATSKP